jgi:HEAT repeat protein
MTNGSPADQAVILEDCRQKLHETHNSMRLVGLARLMLEDIDPSPLLNEIRSCLQDPEESVRQVAVAVLPKVGRSAVDPLISATRTQQPLQVRIAAVAALGRLKGEAQPAIEPLIECLGDEEQNLRTNAILSLSQIGEPAVPHLLACLGTEQENIQIGAIDALGWMGPPAMAAVGSLKTALPGLSLSAQLAGYAALAKITGDAAEGLPMLLAQLGHQDAPIRRISIERTGELLSMAADALTVLLPCLLDPSSEVRAATALALVRIKAQCDEAVETLIPLLKDAHPEARINATIALATIGPAAQTALPDLNTLTNDPDKRLAGIAAAAIQRIEGQPTGGTGS